MIYLGMTIFSLSIVYILYLLIGIMVNGINNPGYFTTIAAVLLIGGIQLISIGVVGEYIGRIYYEVKQRPKYIVQASNLKEPTHASQSSRARERKSTLIGQNKRLKF